MKIRIKGGAPLSGCVRVGGSKNAALPILFSTLLVKGTSEIENLPDIGDVNVALSLLENMGVAIFKARSSVFINTDRAFFTTPDSELVSKIRASTYLIGACLARFGKGHIGGFGGCNFSNRPIDLHLYAARQLGAAVDGDTVSAKHLIGNDITFPKASVGATVNAILMAQGAEGTTVIKGYAKEPHVISLIDFLRSCGADILVSDEAITLKGRALHGAKTKIIGDMIEAGTYAVAAIMTGGEIKIEGVKASETEAASLLLRNSGATVKSLEDCLFVGGSIDRKMFINCGPYPEFPTDLQPIFAPLLSFWGGRIIDNVWPQRFGYLDALSLFGVKSVRIKQGAIIYPSALNSACATAPDLRGGAGCLVAALATKGDSEISSSEIIMRGYSSIVEKLRSLGASVKAE